MGYTVNKPLPPLCFTLIWTGHNHPYLVTLTKILLVCVCVCKKCVFASLDLFLQFFYFSELSNYVCCVDSMGGDILSYKIFPKKIKYLFDLKF